MPYNPNLIFLPHALDQMHDRSISKAEVEACWNDHHTTYTDKKGNQVCIADVNGRRIKIVRAKENHNIIITAAD